MSFRKMKIKINSPEHSEAVQKKLFELGYSWYVSYPKVEKKKEIRYYFPSSDVLWAEEDGSILHGGLEYANSDECVDYPWVDILAEEGNTPQEKPPTGLKPEFIWKSNVEQARVAEIVEAIQRYKKEEKVVPVEWIDELKKLVC